MIHADQSPDGLSPQPLSEMPFGLEFCEALQHELRERFLASDGQETHFQRDRIQEQVVVEWDTTFNEAKLQVELGDNTCLTGRMLLSLGKYKSVRMLLKERRQAGIASRFTGALVDKSLGQDLKRTIIVLLSVFDQCGVHEVVIKDFQEAEVATFFKQHIPGALVNEPFPGDPGEVILKITGLKMVGTIE